MRSKRKHLPLLLAAALMMLLPQPASAHTQYPNSNKVGIMPGSRAGHCVNARVEQQHQWHRVSTFATDCSYYKTTRHTHFQQYYKTPVWGQPGTYCFSEGWHESGQTRVHQIHYDWDIWHRCNNGFNVNVWISIDSRQYSWLDNVGYLGGIWYAATNHCHCP